MVIAGPAGPPTDARGSRRRTREQRRNLRSGAFDLLAVVAALALVGLGLANLHLIGATELAARQGLIAAGGVLALAVFWRFRVRYLGVLGWAAYGAAVAPPRRRPRGRPVRERRHPVDRDRLPHLPALRAGQARAAARPRRRPRLEPAAVAALHAGRAARGRAHRAHPAPAGPQHHDAARRPRRIHAVIGRVPARFLLPLAAAAAISAPLMISLLRPYQLERLGSFLVGAHESPTGSGWAVRQAHIAVGSGGLFGRTDDPLRGLRAQYLPERETDLALASLVGQWGLVAGAGVVLAAIILVWRLALASRSSPHAARRARRRGTGDPPGPRDRRLGRRQPRAAPAGRRPVPAAQLRRDGARRAPGRDRGRPGRPPGRRPEAAVGAAATGATRGRGWSG